jgi:hypothetical protein
MVAENQLPPATSFAHAIEIGNQDSVPTKWQPKGVMTAVCISTLGHVFPGAGAVWVGCKQMYPRCRQTPILKVSDTAPVLARESSEAIRRIARDQGEVLVFSTDSTSALADLNDLSSLASHMP